MCVRLRTRPVTATECLPHAHSRTHSFTHSHSQDHSGWKREREFERQETIGSEREREREGEGDVKRGRGRFRRTVFHLGMPRVGCLCFCCCLFPPQPPCGREEASGKNREREVESKYTEGGREKGRVREGEGCLHVT